MTKKTNPISEYMAKLGAKGGKAKSAAKTKAAKVNARKKRPRTIKEEFGG